MARLAGCVIYNVFKVTSRLRKVFQGTAGPFFIFRIRTHAYSGLKQMGAGLTGRCSGFGVLTIYIDGDLSFFELFVQGIFPLVIWNSLTTAQTFSGSLLELWRVHRTEESLVCFQLFKSSGFSSPFAPVLHGLPSFWPFYCNFTRKLKEK